MSDESSEAEPTGNHRDESTSRNNGKRETSNREASLFRLNEHPELFKISPRPGGFLPHLAAARRNSTRSVIDKSAKKPESSTSGATKGSTLDRASIGEILGTSFRCSGARGPVAKDDKKDNAVRMCSIAISTVMMLAQHIYDNITSEHVYYAEKYFRGLKQSDGYPHNVGQLVELLSNLKTSGKIVSSYIEDAEEENNDEKEK